MYDQPKTNIVGSFIEKKNTIFSDSIKALHESFSRSYQLDSFSDIGKILATSQTKEIYKESLIGDLANEGGALIENSYLATLPEKIEQLFENTSAEILAESSIGQLNPIVGLSLPVLKKSFIEGHSKDIVMTEIPDKPVVNVAFERKFLRDAAGTKYYIPDIYYDDRYKQVLSAGLGKPIPATWFPDSSMNSGNMPISELDMITKAGGSLAARDTLSLNFMIAAVKLQVDSTLETIQTSILPNYAAKGMFKGDVQFTKQNGDVVSDTVYGTVDPQTGKVSVTSIKGLVKKVQFSGNLSNENNVQSVDLDREREVLQWMIPEGFRMNTGLTAEKIKDYKALYDIDVTTEVINDMATTLAQTEDSQVLDFLNTSYDRWKGISSLPFGYTEGFVEQAYFNCEPPVNKPVTRSSWIDTELKYDLNQFIENLKGKLKTSDIMFVMYGHPVHINLIQDNVKWILDDESKIGGIQIDYRFGVYTANKNRIHVVSTMKAKKERGIRIVAYPLSKETITFKHLKYSQNIEMGYRNPITPNIPNVMGVNRYLTKEVLPVQGEMKIINDEFGLRNPSTPATAQCATPTVDIVAGTYTGQQTITVKSATAGSTLFYTVDGSTPDTTKNKLSNGGTVIIASTATLKVIAVKVGLFPSEEFSGLYTIN